jgi:hypothetical protein
MNYLAAPGHLFTLYEVFRGVIRWSPIYAVTAGAWRNIHQTRVLALIVKLTDKMMLLTKKDLNLIDNNCLLDICAKSDLSL